MNLKNRIDRLRSSSGMDFIILLMLCFIPQLIYLTKLGFFWDDWSQLLIHVKYGDDVFWQYFSYDRPGSAWTHILYFPICGSSPVRWHFLFLILKYLLTLVFYKIFQKLFHGEPELSITAAMLFAVCPLFSQQYTAIAYSQHYSDFLLYAVSVYTLIKAAESEKQAGRWFWFFASIISMLAHFSITEYFVFLELMKLPILWICLKNNQENDPAKKSILWCTIPFILFIVYCLLRLNLKHFFPQYNANTPELLFLFLSSPLTGIKHLFRNMTADLSWLFTGFFADIFSFDNLHILTAREIIALFISLALAILSMILNKGKKQIINLTKRNAVMCFILCLVGMVLAILPFWVMDENYLTSGDVPHADRCFMAAMPVYCVLLTLILAFFFPRDTKKFSAAAAVLVFLFIHAQMTVYQRAVVETSSQNSFFQQLGIRIPGVENGTAITDNSIIFPNQGNFSTAAALNILYPNDIDPDGDIPLWIFSYDRRAYQEHGGFHVQKRNYHFNQPPANYIYIDYDNQFSNCLWVFEPEDVDNPHVSDLQKSWIENSNVSRIITDEKFVTDSQIFGKPQSGWCSYYQQASLLRQKEDWSDLENLTQQVLSEGFTPSDIRSNAPFEWWPFIESLVRSGNTEQANILVEEAIRVDGAYSKFFEDRLSAISQRSE